MIKKFISSIVIIALIVMTSGIFSPMTAMAASITSARDILERQQATTVSNHELYFVIPSNISSGQTLTLAFTGFTGMSSIVFGDVDFAESSSAVCTTPSLFTAGDKTLAGTASSTTWGVSSTASNVVLTAGTTGAGLFTGGHCARILIGSNATTGVTGTNRLSNGSVGTATIAITTPSDTGSLLIPIDDGDVVTVSANVAEVVSFDIDVGFTTGDNGAPYTVPLGNLSTSDVIRSNTSTIRQIFLDGSTNAYGGFNVSVKNANGAEGLKSASVGTDYIPNTAGAMAGGVAKYGICVDTASISGWTTTGTTFSTSPCIVNGTVNYVPALSNVTPTTMLTQTVPGPVMSAHAAVQVNAAASLTTPAHSDYADTLYFIATGTF